MVDVAVDAGALKRRRILNIIKGSVFLSVCQHTSNIQSGAPPIQSTATL